MPASRKRTLEHVMPREAVPAALAALTAQAGEGRLVLGGESLDLDRWTELKIGVKPLGTSCLVSVRVKEPGPATVGADSAGPPKYKSVKKRMKQTFKHIGAALAAGRAPDSGALASFVADSRLMITYPGKGDAFYPAYGAAVGRLEAAAAAGDLEAMTRAVGALDRMKKECHSRHA